MKCLTFRAPRQRALPRLGHLGSVLTAKVRRCLIPRRRAVSGSTSPLCAVCTLVSIHYALQPRTQRPCRMVNPPRVARRPSRSSRKQEKGRTSIWQPSSCSMGSIASTTRPPSSRRLRPRGAPSRRPSSVRARYTSSVPRDLRLNALAGVPRLGTTPAATPRSVSVPSPLLLPHGQDGLSAPRVGISSGAAGGVETPERSAMERSAARLLPNGCPERP